MNVELLLARLEERLKAVKRRQSQIDIVNYQVLEGTKIETRKTSWMLLEGEITGLSESIELIKEMGQNERSI